MAGVSPLAPAAVPRLDPVPGVRLATASAGIKYRDRTDVLVAVLDPGTAVAGVLTRSRCPSAPVDWCREHLPNGKARALVVNSGNANAFTGARGRAGTKKIAMLAGKAAGCPGEPGFPRLDRRDRRAARSRQDRGGHRPHHRRRPARPVGSRRARDHDHRHVSEARHRHRAARRRAGAHQRNRQGLRHDHARYGDHARLRLHRCADRGARAARAAFRKRGRYLQRRHRGRRYLDIRHTASVRDRCCGSARRAEDRESERPAARRISQGALRGARRSGRATRRATARARASSCAST